MVGTKVHGRSDVDKQTLFCCWPNPIIAILFTASMECQEKLAQVMECYKMGLIFGYLFSSLHSNFYYPRHLEIANIPLNHKSNKI